MTSNFMFGFMDQNTHGEGRILPGSRRTNDIFDLEERQRETIKFFEDGNIVNKGVDDPVSKKYHETEDISTTDVISKSSKLRRSLSDTKLRSKEQTTRTPPIATGKENVGTHFKNVSKSPVSIPDKKLNDSEDEDVLSPKEQMKRNPITGEGLEVGGEPPNKLEDATNIKKGEDDKQVRKPRRTCIRVREPPGGRSSIVF